MGYQYWMPVKVIEGQDCVKSNGDVFRTQGKKALIVTGRGSARKNGSLQDVEDALRACGVEYVLFDKVMSNPTIECVYEGAALAREACADFVIAIGGGSPMDAAKSIALLTCQDIQPEDLLNKPLQPPILPMVLIPTTAGTGSEVTQYSVLTIVAAQTKKNLASPVFFPTVAMLDAKYTMELPRHVTVNTGVDALSHCLEGMLTVRSNELTDTFARKGLDMIVKAMRKLLAGDVLDYEDRSRLLSASMMGGIVIANAGTTIVHPMGFPLTYFKEIDHGHANGLLMGAMLELFQKKYPERVAEVLGCMGMQSIDEFKQLMQDLLGEPPVRLSAEEIQQYTATAMQAPNVKNSLYEVDGQEMAGVYAVSMG